MESQSVSTPGLLLLSVVITMSNGLFQGDDTVVCYKNAIDQVTTQFCQLKSRRYDIIELGSEAYFHGWVDVQGQGVANDYCRIVGDPANGMGMLSCALAGTHGCSDQNYNSQLAIDLGHKDTWYMRDEDNDGRDDYCRCLGPTGTQPSQVVCTKAGPKGFYGSSFQLGETNTFTLLGTNDCENKPVRPEFGREYVIP